MSDESKLIENDDLMKTATQILVVMLVVTQKVSVVLSLSLSLMIHVVQMLVFEAEIRNYHQGFRDFMALPLCILIGCLFEVIVCLEYSCIARKEGVWCL